MHKAILELWRPDPSELALLLAKRVDSTLLKVPPSAYTLTGSSDPCYVEAYHLTDPSDGRFTLHLKVKISTSLCCYRLIIDLFLLCAASLKSFTKRFLPLWHPSNHVLAVGQL